MTSFVLLTEDNQAVYLVQLLNAITNPKEKKRQEDALAAAQGKAEDGSMDDLEASETKRALESPLGRFVREENYYQLIEVGFFPSVKDIMKSPPVQIDTAFTLVFSLLPRLATQADAIQTVINKLAEILSVDHKSHPALKLRLLAILFNLLGPASHIRHAILMKIFDLALSSRRPKLPLTFIKPLESWIKVWSRNSAIFPPETIASTYYKVAQLADAARDSVKRHDYMYKYVKALEDVKKITDFDLKNVAQAVVEAIKIAGGIHATTTVTDCGRLVDMSSIKELQNTPKYKKLFKLLRIFASEPVDVYLKFQKENTAFMNEFGFNHQDCLTRMRTLTLCDLGIVHQSLTFEELEKNLLTEEGNDDAIEEAVLNAVMAEKIEARIDQENRKVLILRVTWRRFRADDWRYLSDKLSIWKTSLTSVINETFKNRRENHVD